MIWGEIMYILYLIVWVGYLAVLTYIVLFKGTWDNTQSFIKMLQQSEGITKRQKVYLIPFESTRIFIENWEYAYAKWNIFGNMLLFLPFGFLLGLVLHGRKGVLTTLFLGFITSFSFEIIQYLYAIGEFDVDDIMLNVLGAMFGFFLCEIINRLVKRTHL